MSPKSVVVVSVKFTALPLHIAIKLPARASCDPENAVYSINAPAYELVLIPYIDCVIFAVLELITAVVYNDCGDFPRYTSPVASACSTGKPDMSFAENNVPVNESSTENSVPTSPITLNAVDPLCSTTTPVSGAAEADVDPDAIKVGVDVPAPSNVVTLVLKLALSDANAPDTAVINAYDDKS